MVSKQELEGLARKAVAALVGVFLVMALMSALLIAGLVLLLWAATAGLTPVVGQAGALAIAGGACFLLLGLFFWRLLSTPAYRTRAVRRASPCVNAWKAVFAKTLWRRP